MSTERAAAERPQMGTWAKLGLLLGLYLSQGLPQGFFTQALPVLMRQQGLSLPAIGLANLLSVPWALKFLYAPLMDRHGSERYGRRRSFIVPLQLAGAALLAAMSLLDAKAGFGPLFVCVFGVNLLAASQDIPTDALAVDLLDADERGLGNGVQVAGYRVGMIIGGGALLVVFERLGWSRSFLVMSAILLVATVPIALYREPPKPRPPEREKLGPGAVVAWFRRPGLWGWLVMLLVYKTGEALASAMIRAMLVDRKLSLEDLGWLLGTVGFAAGLVGAMLGGALVTRLGRHRALVWFGLMQTAAVATYAWVAHAGATMESLYAVIALEHVASGMATSALFTAMMDVCRKTHAASDYTVQACVVVVVTGLGASLSGFLAQHLGYANHFGVCASISLAAALYVVRYRPTGEFFFVESEAK
jgi:predicted MFS family arabinose efflux permease